MRFRLAALIVFAALVAALAASAQEKPAPVPYSGPVVLGQTGVAGRFVNPVEPVWIGELPLQFFNDTGDRTFVVTIPFVYSAEEAGRAYAIADYERGRQVVSDIVCRVLLNGCTAEEEIKISQLEGLRVLLEAVSKAGPMSLPSDCRPRDFNTHLMTYLQNGGCIAELVFWTATRHQDNLARFARFQGEEDERLIEKDLIAARDLLDRLFDVGKVPFPTESERKAAEARQAEIIALLSPATLQREDQEFESTAHPGSSAGDSAQVAVESFSYEAKGAGLAARFAEARIRLAKKALVEAIREKMGFPKSGKDRFTPEIRKVFKDLQERNEDLAWQERHAAKEDRRLFQCKRREAEAAARLLASYSPDSSVPYTGIPDSIRLNKLGDPKDCARIGIDPEVGRDEEGIEITDCEQDGSSTKCSARATIRPYGKATFSSSILGHHPEPRIRFTVSFFGETEVPANPNGYVSRGEVQKKHKRPKSTFGLQLGGDASSALEPADDFAGQLRHTGANGELSFQYSGQVEASATLQFTTGDFGEATPPAEPGGEPGDPPSEVKAKQYQAKVYGPQGIVLQYGDVPFAKPSSGIAVNVTGEGVQLIYRSASLAYVVLRESAEGQADIKNRDSDLLLLQLKNLGLGREHLRTLDLVGLYGEDRNGNPELDTKRPYRYMTGGFEVRLGTERFPSLGISTALYHSIREFSSEPTLDSPTQPEDAKGTVGLFRLSWTQLSRLDLEKVEEKISPQLGISAILGYGTGDGDEGGGDDGYLGESAGYANDVLFLSSIANSGAHDVIGKGLSNKAYVGLQLTAWRSPLADIATLFGAASDIASQSTILTVHGYRFNEEVHGLNWAGEEIDLVFNLEAPKNIQWVLSGAYYRRSDAIEKSIGLKNDLWSATVKLSIKLDSI